MFAFDPRAGLGSGLMPVARQFGAAQAAELAECSLPTAPGEQTKL